MKKTAFILSIFFFFGLSSYSQVKPEVKEGTISFQGKSYKGYTTSIPYATPDKVLKAWTKTLEKGTRSKVVNENTYEASIVGAALDDITDSLLNVYSYIESKESATLLHAAFETGPDLFISSDALSAESRLAQLFLFEFARENYAEVIEEEVKAEEKILKDMEKDLNQLVREKIRMEKAIENYNSDILVSEDKIKGLEHDLEMKQEEINKQKQKVAQTPTTNKDLMKEEKSTLKGLERDKQKIFNQIEREQKSIVKSKSDIQQNELDIITNIAEQERQRESIELQKIVVQKVEEKLLNLISMEL